MSLSLSAPVIQIPVGVPPDDRVRLMRSTRKLGAILGTTPLIDSSEYASGKIGLKLVSSSSTQPLPRPLVLRLQAVPLPPRSGSTANISRPSTPPPQLKLLPSIPLSPLSPTFSINTVSSKDDLSTIGIDARRRRKMAKLTRTLGENIPPELVFPSSSSKTEQRRARHRSSSVGSLAHLLSSYSTSIPNSPKKDEKVSDPQIHPAVLTKKPYSHLTTPVKRSSSLHLPHSHTQTRSMPSAPRPLQPYTRSRLASNPTPARSLSTSAKTPRPRPLPVVPPTKRAMSGTGYDAEIGYHIIRADSLPSSFDSERTSTSTSSSRERVNSDGVVGGEFEVRAYGRRKEKEWSGEWNKKDMDIVINRLRGLKA